jgi:hypothetical protein
MQAFPEFFSGGSGEHEYSSDSGFSKRWGWYTIFYSLAQGDALRFDAVARLNVFFALNHSKFEHEKHELESAQLKTMMKQ